MIRFLFRVLWRAIIFLLGMTALIYIVRFAWPNEPSQPAVFGALLLTYCLMAYFVIPNLMRLFHVFSKPDHIPLYVTTGDGWPSDPVNLAIIAKNRKHLEKSMNEAGWYTADPLTFKNGLRELGSILFNKAYPEAPLSHLYLFDRAHDIGFEIPTNNTNSARTRHHVRFWRLTKPEQETTFGKLHYKFWSKKLQHLLGLDNTIWIGAATEDTHLIDIKWRTGQITHGVSHEAEKERDFIIKTLADKKLVKDVHASEPGEQLQFRGQSFRTLYTSDGCIKIIQLKGSIKATLESFPVSPTKSSADK
jgi:hypothetical protein